MRDKDHGWTEHDRRDLRRSLEHLRKRSMRRIWWDSARVALRRGQDGERHHPPNGHSATGKRV